MPVMVEFFDSDQCPGNLDTFAVEESLDLRGDKFDPLNCCLVLGVVMNGDLESGFLKSPTFGSAGSPYILGDVKRPAPNVLDKECVDGLGDHRKVREYKWPI